MNSLKGDLTAVGIGLSAGIVAVLLLWFMLSAAKSALTPELVEHYRGTNWVCPAGIRCTNPAHLNFLRRTNNLDYVGTPGGSVGVRFGTK